MDAGPGRFSHGVDQFAAHQVKRRFAIYLGVVERVRDDFGEPHQPGLHVLQEEQLHRAEQQGADADDEPYFTHVAHELFAAGSGKALREEMLAKKALNADGGIDPVDLAMMQALVRRMAKRLAERYSRRRHTANRGHLDVRKTLRKSMAHGGVPFEIEWKIKKVDKPSIVAICDVSKSVAAAAQFLLTFLYSLNDVVDHLDAYAFSGRLIPVNAILDDNGVEGAILKVLQTIGFQQTDYGKALEDFVENHIGRVDRHTTVIILGDGRSNFADPRLDLMHLIQQRARAVIWLNPEPESYWGQGDSVMYRYARFTHVAKQCNTLGQLERIIEDVLRRYSAH